MHTRTLTVALAGLAMLGAFAIDTFLPSFPTIAHDFAITPATVQQLLSAYLLAFSIMCLFYGTLSDAFGRRPVVLVSLVLFSAASVGAAFAPSFGWLLVCRVLQGLSAGAGRVIGQAVIRDRFGGAEAQSMMASVTMVFGLAPAIAPVIGGYLHATYGWRSVFLFLAALGVALLACTWRWVPETLAPASRVPFHPLPLARRYWEALRHRRFLAGAIAVGCAFGGQAIYIASAPRFVMDILHLPETAFAWLFVPMIGGLVVGSATNARLAARVPGARLLRIGFLCMGASSLANLGYNWLAQAALPWAVLPVMGYAFGLGLSLPVMTITTLDLFPKMRGLAASLVTFVQMLAFSLISGVIAPLAYGGAAGLALVVVACFVLTLGFWTYAAARVSAPQPGPGR